MARIDARSEAELLSSLTTLGHSVPLRGCGRTTANVEAWSTSRLLATLARTELLEYPLAYDESVDKPDLRLHFPVTSVGIEITEMVPENYAHALAIANKEPNFTFVEPSLFPWGAPKLTGAEIRAMLTRMQTEFTGNLTGGDGGHALARDWASAVRDTLQVKLEKINDPEYMALPDYWLAIYDNLPFSGLNRTLAASYAQPLIAGLPSFSRSFSRLFVESADTLICFRIPGGDTPLHIPLVHQWGSGA
jgi:hypothetical protein